MTDDLVSAARKALASVTEGPWHVTGFSSWGGDYWVEAEQRTVVKTDLTSISYVPSVAHCGNMEWPHAEARRLEWKANARFIAAARSLVPAMADRIEALANAERATAARAARYKSERDGLERRVTDVQRQSTASEEAERRIVNQREEINRLQAKVARLRELLAEADRRIAWEAHGLGSDFAEGVEAAIAEIEEQPDAAAIYDALAQGQKPLGAEFQAAIFGDVESLYDNKPGKEVMPDESRTARPSHDAAPASLSAGGGAGWQPIETAPKDGTWFVICLRGEGFEIGRFDPTNWPEYVPSEIDGLFRRQERVIYEWDGFNNFDHATHWMPIPAPPATQGGA